MSAEILTNFKGEELQVYQPEEGQPAHCIEYGEVIDNLEDMLDLYEKDKVEFFLTPVTDSRIADVCVRWNRSMKELISCAEGFIRLIGVTEEELVSSDFIGNPNSCIVDLPLIDVVCGNMIKIVAWYDNEWGYSNRLVELAVDFGKEA